MAREIRTYVTNDDLVKERRNQITKSAIKVFYDNGYRGTTIRALAKACGMSEGALYKYIGTKDDILHMICLSRAGGAEPLKKLRADLGTISKTEMLRKCMEALIRMEDGETHEIVFFNREIGNFTHDDRRMLLHSQEDIQQFFEQILDEGVKSGEFKCRSIALMAHNILMIGQDWPLRRWFLKRLVTMEEYTKEQIQFVLDAIAVNPVESN